MIGLKLKIMKVKPLKQFWHICVHPNDLIEHFIYHLPLSKPLFIKEFEIQINNNINLDTDKVIIHFLIFRVSSISYNNINIDSTSRKWNELD